MVGNHLARDIKGANQLGLVSVWLDWSPRRPKVPADPSERPCYTIKNPSDLLDLVASLETSLIMSTRDLLLAGVVSNPARCPSPGPGRPACSRSCISMRASPSCRWLPVIPCLPQDGPSPSFDRIDRAAPGRPAGRRAGDRICHLVGLGYPSPVRTGARLGLPGCARTFRCAWKAAGMASFMTSP